MPRLKTFSKSSLFNTKLHNLRNTLHDTRPSMCMHVPTTKNKAFQEENQKYQEANTLIKIVEYSFLSQLNFMTFKAHRM